MHAIISVVIPAHAPEIIQSSFNYRFLELLQQVLQVHKLEDSAEEW